MIWLTILSKVHGVMWSASQKWSGWVAMGLLQGPKHMVKKCRASWKYLLRQCIALSIHQCHLTANPVVMAVDSSLLIHTSQLIIGMLTL